MTVSPFILLFSNLNQQGYNLTLTPDAKCDDGKLNMICVEKLNILEFLKFIFMILKGKIEKTKKIHSFVFSKMKITNINSDLIYYEIDGEFFQTEKQSLEVGLFCNFLKVISNKKALR